MLGDIISTISVLIAVGSFIWGVRAWRSAFLGQKRIELAEEVHELFLTCVDHIAAIRSPISHGEEGKTRWKNGTETPAQEELLNRSFIPMERIEARAADFSKLSSRANRFDLYFGAGASKPIWTLHSVIRTIQGASIDLSYIWPRQGQPFQSEDDRRSHLRDMHAAQNIVWTGHRDDALAPTIKAAVEEMTITCRQAINPQANFWTSGRAVLLYVDNFFKIPRRDQE